MSRPTPSPADRPPPTGTAGRRRRWWWCAAALAGAVIAAVLARWGWHRLAGDPFPLPPVSASPFLNTGPDAHYVGSEACLPCHGGRHASFRHTGMGRSMAVVDLAQEPPDGVFDHVSSRRRFQIRRQGGELWHRELLLTESAEEVVLAEHPVKYVVGSGRHARTYLADADGFLVESPATWYPSRAAWGVSPGYDRPDHWGFSRPVGEACLFCHVGRAEAVGASLHRMDVTEVAIGCERCHGPGSLHVARHASPGRDGESAAAIDDTIVNPSHLSRDLAEAVCQQCHLNSVAIVPHRGRKLTDFRPGLPWSDFCQVYTPDPPDPSMTVVGHVEQMHLSRCYQASDTLTCRTCHDPHAEPPAAQRVAYYRAKCIACHAPDRCTADPARRARESPADDCMQCHMPRSNTDIPHLAFTHHRIAVHERLAPPPAASAEGGLRPFLDGAPLSDIDRRLSLGEGYRAAALREKDAARAAHYRRRALELLTGVYEAGLRDPDLDAGLAQLNFDMKTGDALAYAQAALAQPGLVGQSRCYALLAVAQEEGQRGDYAAALTALRELTGLRRLATDWLVLARTARATGDAAAEIEALERAARINPRLAGVHRHLADHYRRQGDAARARWHERRAVP